MRKRLSYSSVSTLVFGCARQWGAKYIGWDGTQVTPAGKRAWEPANVYTIPGTAFHAGVEAVLRLKQVYDRSPDDAAGLLTASAWLDPEQRYANARLAYQAAWDREVARGEPNWKGQDPEKAYARGVAMMEAAIEELIPSIEPVHMEWEVEVPIPGVPGWTFLAKIDLAMKTSKGDEIWVADWKTGSFPKKQRDADETHQFTAYGWALREKFGDAPRGYSMFSVTTGTSSNPPECKEIITRRAEGQYDWWLGVLQNAARQAEAGAFAPNDHYQYCKSCPIRPTCMPWTVDADQGGDF